MNFFNRKGKARGNRTPLLHSATLNEAVTVPARGISVLELRSLQDENSEVVVEGIGDILWRSPGFPGSSFRFMRVGCRSIEWQR
jgi:hypothetical protein